MNCLLVYPGEITDGSRGVLTGERARMVRDAHALSVGATVTAGVLGGKLGRATVTVLSNERCELSLELTRDPPPRLRADLIVAVPRPQTVKKIVHLGCALGVERIHFIRTLNTVKSYLQSGALSPAELEGEIVKGLEQAVDTAPPVVAVHRSFEQFASSELPVIAARASRRYIADTRAVPRLDVRAPAPIGGVALAIGPEAGWSPKELEAFFGAQFSPLNLGPRMLRVDIAAVIALAELDLVGR